MREAELRSHADCSVCKKKIGHAGVPMFWTLHIERHIVDLRAAQQQDGLAQFLGSAELASVMGPDRELTKQLISVDLTLCEECAIEARQPLPIAALAEFAENPEDEEEANNAER